MAIPPTVIAGEIVTDEWGNAVRDWAVYGVVVGAATEVVSDFTIDTTYETGASVTFTPPASWVTFSLMAWGTGHFTGSGPGQGNVRISIGGTTGTSVPFQAAGAAVSASANQVRTGLSGLQTVTVQYNEAGASLIKISSTIQYVATRTT